jgi:hypothetical protein
MTHRENGREKMNFKQKAKMFTQAVSDTANTIFANRLLQLVYLAKGMDCRVLFDDKGFYLHSTRSHRLVCFVEAKI